MTESQILHDDFRPPVIAHKQMDGDVILRGHKSAVILSQHQLDQLTAFAHGKATIQRYGAPPRSPQTGE